jgi:hypothetical protein
VVGALAIQAVAHRAFGPGEPYTRDPRRLRHYRDLLEPYGVALDERLLERGGRHSFRAMGAAVVADVEAPPRVDLVVLAHATPDFDPILSAASHLAFLCPGQPRAFAVSDHGVGAPFAGLRMIAAHLRSPAYATALLVVLDQTSLPNYDARVHRRHTEDSAVALALGRSGPAVVAGVERRDRLDPGQASRAVADLARTAAARTVVLAGSGVDVPRAPRTDGVLVHRAPAQHHCTAVWVALSEHLDRWRHAYDRVVVADYDEPLRQLHTASITLDRKPA